MERELLLLGLLRRQDMHGYLLAEYIANDMATCVAIKKPTAYYLLDRMAKQGWVTRAEEQNGNRPIRSVYAITLEGEAAFQRLLRENLGAYHATEFPGDVGIGFLDELPQTETEGLLQQRRAALLAVLEETRRVPAHGGSMQDMIAHRLHYLNSELTWLDGLISQLKVAEQTTSRDK